MAVIRYLFFLFIIILILAIGVKWILVLIKKLKNAEKRAFEKFETKMLPKEKEKVVEGKSKDKILSKKNQKEVNKK